MNAIAAVYRIPQSNGDEALSKRLCLLNISQPTDLAAWDEAVGEQATRVGKPADI